MGDVDLGTPVANGTTGNTRGRNEIVGVRALMAAVIDRAMDDLKGTGLYCTNIEVDRAMAFILSEYCEALCLELEIDYRTIRKRAASLYRKVIEKEKEPKTRGRPCRQRAAPRL